MNKILIAEDETPIANLLQTALEGAGYRCVRAADGAAVSSIAAVSSHESARYP